MGRELKRVPLDFDAPLNQVWRGYFNPHYRKCPDCKNGYTKSAEALNHLVHLLLIAGRDSLKGTLHPWLREAGLESVGSTMHELTSGLAGRSPDRAFGHDACDRWAATKKIVEAAGLPESWGTCPTCDGNALHPEAKEAYEAWKEIPPPLGDGYQLWSTTSEGSPVSPVFGTLEALCEWCADGATTFGHSKATAEEWRSMLDAGFVHHREGNAVFI